MTLQPVGDYRYGGVTINGRKFSVVRNGDELLRVSEVFDNKNAVQLWNEDQPMTLQILEILEYERNAR